MTLSSFTFIQEPTRSGISYDPSLSANTGVDFTWEFETGLLQFDMRGRSAIALGCQTSSDTAPKTPSAPPELSPAHVKEFEEKWLTYRRAPEGHWICVWKDPETQEEYEFIYGPQDWINDHPPQNVGWEKHGVISHEVLNQKVYHFNADAAEAYSDTVLVQNNLILWSEKTVNKLLWYFRDKMLDAFGFQFTSWSPDGGRLGQRDDEPEWFYRLIGGYCLVVKCSREHTTGLDSSSGCSLFLQRKPHGTHYLGLVS